MTLPRSLILFGALGLTSTGCAEYFDLEKACHPEGRVPGGNQLENIENDAMDRLNCYRRVAGLSRLSINSQVQATAKSVKNYILTNPDADRLFTNPNQFLNQEFDNEGFTGANAQARLEWEQYFFSDPSGTSVGEILVYADDTDGTPALLGSEAIDRLMRVALFREHGLQPSWVDGGYVEIELNSDWYTRAGVCGDLVPKDTQAKYGCVDGVASATGRFYYMVSIHGDPHLEKASQPFLFPKHEQEGVALWSGGYDLDEQRSVEIGYPISVYGGVIDPMNYNSGNANPFGLRLANAELSGGGNVVDARAVTSSSDAEGRYPSGLGLRKTAVVYPREPLLPNTNYTLTMDVTTNEAEFSVEVDFTTRGEDLSTLPAPVKTAARTYSPREVQAFVAQHPHMAAPRKTSRASASAPATP